MGIRRYENLSRQVISKMLEQAASSGHVISLEYREAHDGNGSRKDAPTKYWVRCSCGYDTTSSRSVSAALAKLAAHAGSVTADGSAAARRNGVRPATPAPPAPRRDAPNRVKVTPGGTTPL